MSLLIMRVGKRRMLCSAMDLSNWRERRVFKKSFRRSDEELTGPAAEVGNWIAIIGKKAALQRVKFPTNALAAAVIVASDWVAREAIATRDMAASQVGDWGADE
jgi:hypothetical protein